MIPKITRYPYNSFTKKFMKPKWEGIFAALWTPTDKNGRLQTSVLKSNVRFIRQFPVQGFLALASTGEFIYLDVETRKKLLAQVIKLAAPLPVIANISDINPRVVADLGRFAKKAGAAAVALLPPYFYSFSQNELVEWFVRGGQAAQLPLFLYNFPELTGNKIELKTIDAICQRTRVAAIKQSGSEFSYHKPLIHLGRKNNFVVFTGADLFLANVLKSGAVGCIGGFANVIPDLMTDIFIGHREKDPARVRLAGERINQLWKIVEPLGFPLNVAAAMEARGLPPGEPKAILSKPTRQLYAQKVQQLKKCFQKWKLISK